MKLSTVFIYVGLTIIIYIIAAITKNKILNLIAAIMIILMVLYYGYLFIKLGSLFSSAGF